MSPTMVEPFWAPREYCCEDVEQYHAGGFCPITIYQVLHDGRYRIVYKLGYGGFSTVWLAQDLQENSYVALKVLAASQYGQSRELQILQTLRSQNAKNVLRLLDSFDHESTNGTHHIIVTPVTRSLKDMKILKGNFAHVVKGLIEGLRTLHAAGIVHGDIHTSNLSYEYVGFSTTQFEDLMPPEVQVIPPQDSRPPYLVSTEEWMADEQLDKQFNERPDPIILDFGRAFLEKERTTCQGGPLLVPKSYIPPEYIFESISPRSGNTLHHSDQSEWTDIWAMGAAIFELAVGRPLVRGSWGRSPQSLYLKFDNRLPQSTQQVDNDSVDAFWDLACKTIDQTLVPDEDKPLFKDFLLSMVCLDPQYRLTGRDLLQHKYLAGV